jgi:hypothetical protein
LLSWRSEGRRRDKTAVTENGTSARRLDECYRRTDVAFPNRDAGRRRGLLEGERLRCRRCRFTPRSAVAGVAEWSGQGRRRRILGGDGGRRVIGESL